MTKYKIIFCDAATGKVLTEYVHPYVRDPANRQHYIEVDNYEDAIACKNNCLKIFPLGEVTIIKGEERQTFYDGEQLAQYHQFNVRWYRWKKLPFLIRWIRKEPEFRSEWYYPGHRPGDCTSKAD